MDRITLVELNSLKSSSGSKKTDSLGYEIQGNPSYMVIDIYEPVVGGDTSNGSKRSLEEVKNGIFEKSVNTVTGLANAAQRLSDEATGVSGGDFIGPRRPSSEILKSANVKETLATNVSTNLVSSIALPMSTNLDFADNATWADDNSAASDIALAGGAQLASSLGKFGQKSLVGGLLDAVSAQAAYTAVKKVGQKSFGIGLEPRKEMYYDGPVFREFSFTWSFSAKNANETNSIKEAIKVLRKHSYPERLSESVESIGFEVWKLPSTYSIKFNLGDETNTFIPQIKPSVLTNITTNLTKEGQWKQYIDGSPLAIDLSVTFKEVEIVTQQDVEDGF